MGPEFMGLPSIFRKKEIGKMKLMNGLMVAPAIAITDPTLGSTTAMP